RPARFSAPRCTSWRIRIRRRGDPNSAQTAPLFRSQLQRRYPRQNDLDSRAAAGFGIEVEPAAEPIGHDAVDDVQAEAGAALIAPCREERIERTAADVEAHAASIV